MQENDKNNSKNTVILKFHVYREDVYGGHLIFLVTSEVLGVRGGKRVVLLGDLQWIF